MLTSHVHVPKNVRSSRLNQSHLSPHRWLILSSRSLEKRLHTQWGKRAESNSDELYQRILRELYHSARLTQAANPHYSANHDGKFLLVFTG